MNYQYLMHYISCRLHTIIKRYPLLPSSCPLPSLVPDESFCSRYAFTDASFLTEEILRTFYTAAARKFPLLLTVNYSLIYASVPTPEGLFVVGPVRFSSSASLKTALTASKMPKDFPETAALCDFTDFADCVLLIYNSFQENFLNRDTLLFQNVVPLISPEETQQKLADLIFHNQEMAVTHNPYDQELREFSSIENGDLEMLQKSFEEDYPGQLGTLSENPLRQLKNLGIVVTTLACRASIRGGVLPEIAYSLSDIHIQKLDSMQNPAALYPLIRTFEMEYARLVQDLKKQTSQQKKREGNPTVEQCKDYIFKHLHEKTRIPDIARELYLNPNYLSNLFRRHEGISIVDFVAQEKFKLVKNLLTYSNYSYIEIASYLGFSSQSHLGKQFKAQTGMTLKQYRDKYHVREFL